MEECPICFDVFDETFTMKPCNHVVCISCWSLIDHEFCIICREVLCFGVKIKLLDGKLLKCDIGYKMTCLDIRKLLNMEIQLVYKSKVINDNTIISNIIVSKDNLIHLVRK